MYEFEPASGIKVQRIVSLQDDLALALRALRCGSSRRCPARQWSASRPPTRSARRCYLRRAAREREVPRQQTHGCPSRSQGHLRQSIDADLAKMPHLARRRRHPYRQERLPQLAALLDLCRRTPDELKLLLIDPKLLELSIYAGSRI